MILIPEKNTSASKERSPSNDSVFSLCQNGSKAKPLIVQR